MGSRLKFCEKCWNFSLELKFEFGENCDEVIQDRFSTEEAMCDGDGDGDGGGEGKEKMMKCLPTPSLKGK